MCRYDCPMSSALSYCIFLVSLRCTESDDQTASPRRQPQVITRNAEELACHVLHGSLRLTPSRQQILSFSGISLEERASTLQEDAPYSESVAESASPVASGSDPAKQPDPNPLEPVAEVVESETESTEPKKTRGRGRPPKPRTGIRVSKSDSYVAKIKKKALKFKKKSYGMQRDTKPPAQDPGRPQARHRRPIRHSRGRLPSGTGTSASENDLPVNGITEGRVPGSLRQHRSEEALRTRAGSSSSVCETPLEELSNVDKIFQQRLGSSSETAIPSASSVEDLTVKPPLVVQSRKRGKKRKQSSGSEGAVRKRRKLTESKLDSLKNINGLVNGGESYEIKPLDLVWAKCRGYPPYPALVSTIECRV